MRFKINLLEDGSVVTQEGECLGTWAIDDSDAFYEFTPEGATEYIFIATNIPSFCDKVIEWQGSKEKARLG